MRSVQKLKQGPSEIELQRLSDMADNSSSSSDGVSTVSSGGAQQIQYLMDLVNEIGCMGDYRRTHKKDCLALVRRIKLLLPLFEELKESLQESHFPQPLLHFSLSLEKSLRSAKGLLQMCHEGSKLYLVVENEAILGKFMKVSEELDKSLDALPFSELKVSDEVREQIELMHSQLKRSKGRADTQDVELFMDLMIALSHKGARNADPAVLERLASKLQLETASDIVTESRAIKKLVKERGGKIDETLENITYLLKKIKSVEGDKIGVAKLSLSEHLAMDTSTPIVPEDYRCPISLDLMTDPVIVATGQTYDRSSIQQWFDTGHRTCPKTQQVLSHLTLTPNYVLRSLIAQWCENHGIELPSQASSSQPDNCSCSFSSKSKINILVQKLYSKQTDLQRQAAEEVRLLAKRNADNRLLLAEAGAIPQLVKLLSSKDAKTQEHAVTALLNLSIHSSNKGFIVQAGAINRIIEVLKHGTMEAQENAAATLFSLSVIDENKVTIGAAGAIPPLVDLLRDGTPRGKKDAATALFNLSIYQVNKARAVRAGVVPPLMALLLDQGMGMVDEALAILAILATHQEGRVAIGQQSAIHSLVELINSGSARNKENAAAVLLALSVNESSNLWKALHLGVYNNLVELSEKGTARARRKATALLELMGKEKYDL
eukprot:TRINITY_DN6153_c0_g1_i1.p1 TRINITY_DN6153_c0_g1~~TRINITY_DN6153_c0_g1_i1.p1  ORF type:complete len:661 (+),score=133.53 TRINITY_DN6153_c0_g1_i1:300-2282(+)